ncbi:histidine kinase [Mycobacterium aquaticum]|uniref:Histidine kinase n=1 Tax=Mycobacterium aquaticum TaxID=1927124 RepID=A0A1X0B637_9MYCO|nr:histidine kinase [Mycobacterium aquaticum]ORA37782.1 histidine kinase [Mycobacterium aquaticum]
MDLQPYVDAVRHELAVAAAAGGADAEALAQRLTAPLDSALRLALLEALSEAAEQITRELAPGAVHVRLAGRDPEFAVELPEPAEPAVPSASSRADVPDDDSGGTWRVTLRLPESLRAGVESAARGEGISVNAWLVRSASARLGAPAGRTRSGGKSFSGWVR